MTAILTDELREQLGDLFVRVRNDVRNPAERARLHERGVRLLAAHMDLIEFIAFGAHLPIPKLEIIAPDQSSTTHFERADETPVIVLAADSPHADADLVQALKDYAANSVSTADLEKTAGGRTLREADLSRQEKDRSGFGFHARRGTYDLTEGPDHSKVHRNTEGDLHHYRHMREDARQRPEWEFWRDYLFDEKQLERFSRGDWLRSLRVLNGLGIKDMEAVLGINNSAYSKKENRSDKYSPTGKDCDKILKRNIFHLPADENGAVREDYARKFLHKMAPKSINWLVALDPEWLAAQDEKKRPGLLLRAFRVRAAISRKGLADNLGLVELAITHWENGIDAIDASKLPDIAEHLHLTPKEHTRLDMICRLRCDPQWLVERDNGAGLLLAAFRKRAGLSQEVLAENPGVDARTLGYWESGRHAIDVSKLPLLAEHLHLSLEEKECLALLCAPALDSDWLSRQEEDKRAGLLLMAFRKRTGLSQKELGERLDLHQETVLNWETGKSSIAVLKLPSIAEQLGLSPEESNRLYLLCLPALNPDWLSRQDEDKRAALLVGALRQRMGLTQQALAERVGAHRDTIRSCWENGGAKISNKYLSALIGAFRDIPGFDEAYFQGMIENSNRAIRERQACSKADTKLGARLRAGRHPELADPRETRKSGPSAA
jgi:transcriptional regulator with XRE-family HTH domain